MTYKILISTILLSLNAIIINGQDLGQSRISNLKQSVVRILVNHKPSGTAFFVREDGWLLTCQHVLEPAMVRDSTNNIIDLRPIHIEFYDGEKIEVGVLTGLLNKLYPASLAYDFSLVKVQTWPKNKIEPLKLGNWESINEGDEIYTSGYPLGIKQNVISKGMLSTKWVDTVYLSNIAHQTDAITRRAAWLDLTMNKGNSGGPIIRMGNSNEQDIVVGISTFILNPYANDALILEKLLSSNTMPDILYGDMSQNKIKALFASAIANNSIGISGCISINYAAEVLKQIPKTTNKH